MSSRTVALLLTFGCLTVSVSGQYDVGANYHATTSDFEGSSFIKHYDQPAIRATVLTQLQGMADAGATRLKLNLWQVLSPEESDNWKLGFPLSAADLFNIQTYAQDVANIQAQDGHRLTLLVGLGWLWCAEYTVSIAPGTVGQCSYDWPEFVSRARQSAAGLLQTLAPIVRPDGVKVVETVYLDGELMIGAKANQEAFLTDVYGYFVQQAQALGVNGTAYFLIASGATDEVFDNGFTDGQYPAINGHKSLYWIYRTTEFMRLNGLPIPDRLDVSFYPHNMGSYTYAQVIHRVWDDLQAVYPTHTVGVVETYYFPDQIQRRALGQAYANEYLARGMPTQTVFWTTPNGGGDGVNVGYPFVFADYQPSVLPDPPPPPVPPPCRPRGRSGKCK